MSLKDIQKELNKKGYNIKFANQIKEEAKIKTGLYPLDYVLDGGICQCEGGHRIEFWGAESSGKTTFALCIIKKYQELGKTCVFVDAENSYDSIWAEILGVDNSKVIIIKPNTLEEMGDMLPVLIPQVDLIVIDSLVSLIPEEELERDTNQPTMGLKARVNSIICDKIYNKIGDRFTTLIFINQMREKIGVMYGNPQTAGGGHAIKHLYSTRVEFRLGKPIEEGKGEDKERVGYEINLKCIKNKKGIPYRTAVVDFYFEGRLDNKKSLLYSAIKYGIIKRAGAWFEYKDIKEQGKEKLIEKISDKDWLKIQEEIWKQIK